MKTTNEKETELHENIEDLLKKFQKLESELLETLKISSNECFDEKLEPSVLKKNIKSYIKKVNKAKQIFDEYEMVAQKIEKLTCQKKSSIESIEKVVDLRKTEENEDEKADIQNKVLTKLKANSEYKDQILIDENGKPISVKKKASGNNSKEF